MPRTLLLLIKSSFVFLLIALLYFVASGREIDLSDESLYFYEAWAAWGSASYVPPSWPLRMNFGWLLGLPLILFSDSSLLLIRLFSLCLWLGGFGVLFYAYARHLRAGWLFPFVVGLVLFSVLIPTLSYQPLPYILFAAAGGFFLLAATNAARFLAARVSLFFTISALLLYLFLFGSPLALLRPVLFFPFPWSGCFCLVLRKQFSEGTNRLSIGITQRLLFSELSF